MILKHSDYRKILRAELNKRCELNSQYTLRAFARDLGIGPARLSEVLNGKQGLSIASADKIAKKIGLNAYEKDYFITLIESTHARSKSKRELARVNLLRFRSGNDLELKEDSWELISEWYHLAIMELTKIRGFQNNVSWIADRLAITKEEASAACARLIRLNILKEEKGKLKVTGDWMVFSPNEVPSESIRKFHETVMKKASLAVRRQSIEKRNLTSLILAIDEEQIPEAKEMIMEFVRKLDSVMMTSRKRNRVYCFSSQFFALDEDKV